MTRSGLLVLNAIQLVTGSGYSPGLSEILGHSELIPDAALTLTRKSYNEIHSQKIKIVTPSSLELRTGSI